MKLYIHIAHTLLAMRNCEASGNLEWFSKHREDLRAVNLPSGSGFDNGSELDPKSTPEKLVFTTSFHHMNENGMYDGWTDHTVTVRPSLVFGFLITVGGKNRNDIKAYVAEMFECALNSEVGS